MTALRILTGAMFAGMSAVALAQASPAPATGTTAAPAASQAAGTQGASEAEKKAADGASGRDGGAAVERRRDSPDYVPPMNIRMKDEGIALPKCVRESREGEACR